MWLWAKATTAKAQTRGRFWPSAARLQAQHKSSPYPSTASCARGLNIVGTHTEASVNIRGVRSILSPSTPLYVVDGVIVPTLDGYSVSDVDYVEVMKDASIYGAQGANGALLIHTRRY